MKTFFDPIAHQYFLNDRPVPSVTQVIHAILGDAIWYASDFYLGRGQAVHACAALVARGKDFEFDQQIAGQVAALRRFFSEVKPVVLAVELPVYSVKNQYAGTLDLLTHKPGTGALMVSDFKSSLTKATVYQCAFYAAAYEEQEGKRVDWGCGVEIRENGTYQMSKIYDLRIYKRKCMSLLDAFNIRRECGIKEEDAA